MAHQLHGEAVRIGLAQRRQQEGGRVAPPLGQQAGQRAVVATRQQEQPLRMGAELLQSQRRLAGQILAVHPAERRQASEVGQARASMASATTASAPARSASSRTSPEAARDSQSWQPMIGWMPSPWLPARIRARRTGCGVGQGHGRHAVGQGRAGSFSALMAPSLSE
jgi:hypothetical protein